MNSLSAPSGSIDSSRWPRRAPGAEEASLCECVPEWESPLPRSAGRAHPRATCGSLPADAPRQPGRPASADRRSESSPERRRGIGDRRLVGATRRAHGGPTVAAPIRREPRTHLREAGHHPPQPRHREPGPDAIATPKRLGRPLPPTDARLESRDARVDDRRRPRGRAASCARRRMRGPPLATRTAGSTRVDTNARPLLRAKTPRQGMSGTDAIPSRSWGTMHRSTCVRRAMPWRLSARTRTPTRITTATSA